MKKFDGIILFYFIILLKNYSFREIKFILKYILICLIKYKNFIFKLIIYFIIKCIIFIYIVYINQTTISS